MPKASRCPFQPVSFVLKTSLGELDYGGRPTDEQGKAQVIVRDHRYGQYPMEVIYRGDGTHQASRGLAMVDFGPRPAAALPEAGVLISPNFSPSIGFPFLFFYRTMWCVFVYTIGYLILWRMRRERGTARVTGGSRLQP